jgi:hypothetical protein
MNQVLLLNNIGNGNSIIRRCETCKFISMLKIKFKVGALYNTCLRVILLLRRMGINTLHGHSPNSVDVNLSEITLNFILLYFVVNHSIGLFYNK